MYSFCKCCQSQIASLQTSANTIIQHLLTISPYTSLIRVIYLITIYGQLTTVANTTAVAGVYNNKLLLQPYPTPPGLPRPYHLDCPTLAATLQWPHQYDVTLYHHGMLLHMAHTSISYSGALSTSTEKLCPRLLNCWIVKHHFTKWKTSGTKCTKTLETESSNLNLVLIYKCQSVE